MSNDITVIYYTANTIADHFAMKIRAHLVSVCSPLKIPIVCVCQKPMSWTMAEVIHVEELIPSVYNVYKQIFIGAKIVKTPYVACCEDDSLYTSEHFDFRPTEDVFLYNKNRWRIYPDFFLFKRRSDPTSPGMWNCIAPTELMIKTLETRFKKYPEPSSMVHWGEPGRYEGRLGLPRVKAYNFQTKIPNLTFAHRGSLGGVRKVGPNDITISELPAWGTAKSLWEAAWDGKSD